MLGQELDVTQIGVVGLFIMVVLREVFNFVGRNKRNCFDYARIERQIAELHEWHAKTDDEGVKIWYVRRSLETAINKLATNIETMANIFHTMQTEMHDMRRDIRDTQAPHGS